MTLERFRQIKARLEEINNLYGYKTALDAGIEEEILIIAKEIERSDLSEIDFSEYNGFIDYGFNFENTNANIDFSIIRLLDRSISGTDRNYRGCNVRNIESYRGKYDESMFDDEIITSYPDRFLKKDILVDGLTRDRFYASSLDKQDIEILVRAREEARLRGVEVQSLSDDNLISRANSRLRRIYARFSADEINNIPGEVLDMVLPAFESIAYNRLDASCEEIIKEAILSAVSSFDEEKTRTLYSHPYVRSIIPEIVIDEETHKDLSEKIIARELSLSDVLENREYLKDKRYVHAMKDPQGLTEEKIKYFSDNYEDLLLELMRISSIRIREYIEQMDSSKTREENFGLVKDDILRDLSTKFDIIQLRKFYQYFSLEEMIRSQNRSFTIGRNEIIEILNSSTDKKIVENNFPIGLLDNYEVRYVVQKFGGLDAILDFDRVNNKFMSGGEYAFLSYLYEAYFMGYQQVAGTEADFMRVGENGTVPKKFTLEDFNEAMARMIKYGPTRRSEGGFNGIEEELSITFKEQYPELFVSEEAPERLRRQFYRREIRIRDVLENPNWLEYITTEQLSMACARSNIVKKGTTESILSYMLNKFGKEETIRKLGTRLVDLDYLVLTSSFFRFDDFDTVDEFDDVFDELLYEQVITKVNSYPENLADSFKQKHPELFLEESDEISDSLKSKFYRYIINPNDVRDNPELARQIRTKDITVCMAHYVNPQLLETIDKDTLLDLYEVYGTYAHTIIIKYQNQLADKSKDELDAFIMEHFDVSEYSEDAPDFFKELHPDLFISESASNEIKAKFYPGFAKNEYSVDRNLSFDDLVNPEYIEALRGKSLKFVKNDSIKALLNYFSEEDIFYMAKIDRGALAELSRDGRSISRLHNVFFDVSIKRAQKDILGDSSIDEETKKALIEGKISFESLEKYNNRLDRYRNLFIKNYGLILHYETDELEDMNIQGYIDVKSASKIFEGSSGFSRPEYEKIIANMYRAMGVSGAKYLLSIPQIDEETLDNLIRESAEDFNKLYESKFGFGGFTKVSIDLIKDISIEVPGNKKDLMNFYKSINSRFQDGFDGNIEELLEECFYENGIVQDRNSIENRLKNVRAQFAAHKYELIKEELNSRIGSLRETPDNIKILKDIVSTIIINALKENERFDIKSIKQLLDKEMARKKNDEESFYSPQIIGRKDEILDIIKEISSKAEYKDLLRMDLVDVMAEQKDLIGKGWLRKLISLANLPEYMPKEIFEEVSLNVYGENVDKVESKSRIDLKDNSQEGKKAAYSILAKNEYPEIMTYEKAKRMFLETKKTFTPELRDFILKYRSALIADPFYYDNFREVVEKFEEALNDFEKANQIKSGEYTLESLAETLRGSIFSDVRKGEYDLEYRVRNAGYKQGDYEIFRNLFYMMKKRTSITIPTTQTSNSRFVGRILRIDDPLHFVIGNKTSCCQRVGVGYSGESAMIHSAIKKNGSVFVVEELDEYGKSKRIVGQSWVWRNGSTVCFDNVEMPEIVQKEFSNNQEVLEQIMQVYEYAGRKMIKTDKLLLEKLYKAGRISKEQLEMFGIDRITMGSSNNKLTSELKKIKYRLEESPVKPLEVNEDYKYGRNNGSGLYLDSEKQYVLIEGERREYVPIYAEYYKTREVISRSGENINPDMIEGAKEIAQKEGVSKSPVLSGAEKIGAIVSCMDTPFLRINQVNMQISSNKDWYMITSEDSKRVILHDGVLLSKGREKPRTEVGKLDVKLSYIEYSKALYILLDKATSEGKEIVIKQDSNETFFKRLVESGIIEMSPNGSIKVVEDAKLKELIKSLSDVEKEYQDQRVIATGRNDEEKGM